MKRTDMKQSLALTAPECSAKNLSQIKNWISFQSVPLKTERSYGRVSTEHEAQLAALENQIQWYDDQAKYHPNWNVLDKYIDEGITGTQAKKRPAFLQMIEDAKQGKFDLIVTREVCRFARNTVDTLVTTRELKNIGVEVYFVEDNIWTMDGDGELRLTIMATLAQEESRKVSERVKAGQQISRQNGMVYGCGNILGYDRQVGETYKINPEQAETVRMIYDMYLDGLSTMAIANELTRRQRLNASGKNKWTAGVVCRILNNQTYMGVMAYGKSFSNNYLEQKRVNNHDASTYMCVKSDFEPITKTTLYITVSHKTADEMSDQYRFNEDQDSQLEELLNVDNSMWLAVLYGIYGSDDMIVQVALSQIGNVGGEPYWSWYGFGSRVEWCACFVSWCADQCGYIETGVCPKYAGCVNGVAWFKEHNQWVDGSETPSPGMIIFYDWDSPNGESGPQDGLSDHTGIVERVENGIVYTVEGNSGDSCRQCHRAVGNYEILGYGVLIP